MFSWVVSKPNLHREVVLKPEWCHRRLSDELNLALNKRKLLHMVNFLRILQKVYSLFNNFLVTYTNFMKFGDFF